MDVSTIREALADEPDESIEEPDGLAARLGRMALGPARAAARSGREALTGEAGTRAMHGERVEERVRGGVVGLARGAEDAGHRREQHECIEGQRARQLVQVHGRIDLRSEHAIDARRIERRDETVVDDARAVKHRA